MLVINGRKNLAHYLGQYVGMPVSQLFCIGWNILTYIMLRKAIINISFILILIFDNKLHEEANTFQDKHEGTCIPEVG